MKKKLLLFLFFTLSILILYSCIQQPAQIFEQKVEYAPDATLFTTGNGRLKFNSADDLQLQAEVIRRTDNIDLIKNHHMFMATRGGEPFISLRDELISQGLREFSDEELQQIIYEELIYEPQDDIINDEYFQTLLNAEREIQVGDKGRCSRMRC